MSAEERPTEYAALRVKLLAVAACVAAGVLLISFVAVHFPSAQLASLDASLRTRAGSYARMVSIQAGPVVAFDDRESAREIFDSVTTDPSVTRLALYRDTGRLIYASGESRGAAPSWVDRPVLSENDARVRVVSPVVTPEGPRGLLVVEVSRAETTAQRRSVRTTAALVGLLALLIGCAAAWSVGTSVRLARAVQRQGEELDDRNRALRRVLANVGQGFLTVGRDGVMASERSAILDLWFGPSADGARLWDYLASVDPRAAAWCEMGWSALQDGVLPVELVIDQLPHRVEHAGTVLDLQYRPMVVDGEVVDVVVVISDVTAEAQRARMEAGQRELMCAFEAVLKDRASFEEFFAEAEELVRSVTAGADDHADALRAWHTLKGNLSLYGLVDLASLCHEIEARMADDGAAATFAECERLNEAWGAFAGPVTKLLGCGSAPMIEIEPATRHLERLGAHARELAERLGKGDIEITVENLDARLPRPPWVGFWAASVHAVRNAVDHGLESPDERLLAGKPTAGRLTLRAFQSGDDVVIEIVDDGRGIAWDRVAERAAAAGLPHATRDDLVEALFASGFSTRDAATETSGRGVGMGALRVACARLGGALEVLSERGRGTTLRCRLPAVATPRIALRRPSHASVVPTALA